MRKIRSQTFNGRKYHIVWKVIPDTIYKDKAGRKRCFKLFGLCDPPFEKGKKEITINLNQGKKQLLGTCIHESLHAFFKGKRGFTGTKEEKKITKQADELTNFLWKMGYRMDK